MGAYGPKLRSIQLQYRTSGAFPLTQEQPVSLNRSQIEVELIDYVINIKLSKSGRKLAAESLADSPIKDYMSKDSYGVPIGFEELHRYFRRSEEVKGWFRIRRDDGDAGMKDGFVHINRDTIVNLLYAVSIDFSISEQGKQCMIKMCNGEVFMTDDERYVNLITKEMTASG